MFNNMKYPCPAILFISNHTECLSRDIQGVCTTVLCPPRYGKSPKCSKSTLCYMNVQYPTISSKFIQTMYSVHAGKSSQQHKQFIST